MVGKRLWLRLQRAFLRRLQDERDLDDEIRFHLSEETRLRSERGQHSEEARRGAHLAFGNAALVKESIRSIWVPLLLEQSLQDLRYARRTILNNPAFAAVAVAALAVGIGLNTMVFSLVNAILLKPLPFPEGHELVFVDTRNPRTGAEFGVSLLDVEDWLGRATTFEDLAAFTNLTVNLSDDLRYPERVSATRVGVNAFRLLDQQVLTGRGFVTEDAAGGASRVALISQSLWETRYGGDPEAIGTVIRANGEAYTIVGAMPAGMNFPVNTDVWLPIREVAADTMRDDRGFRALGRLRDGVSIAEAQAELTSVAETLSRQYPETNENIGVRVRPPSQYDNNGELQATFLNLMGTVTFVLLIACANVANLSLAQALRRTPETSMRAALGAGRLRIARQMLAESLLLSAMGAALGLGLAYLGVNLFDRATTVVEGRPYWIDFSIDYRVFAYLGVVSVGTAILFGLIPAIQASRADLNGLLKDSSRSTAGAARARRWTGALVVAELALTLVLLAGAGVTLRGLVNLQQLDFGVETRGLVTAQLILPDGDYPGAVERAAFQDRLLDRLRGTAELESVTLSVNPPGFGASATVLRIPGRDLSGPRGEERTVDTVSIATGFFETFAVDVLEGRDFAATDGTDASPAVIVNSAFADFYWPGESALGRSLQLGPDGGRDLRVVGLVPPVLHRVETGPSVSPRPTVYVPMREAPDVVQIIARGRADDAATIAAVRTVLAEVDPDLPIEPVTYEAWLADQTWFLRVLTGVIAAAAGIALALSAAGIFGVTSYAVDRRTSEIGIRIALGASGRNVLWLVTRQGMVQLLLGLGLGFVGAVPLTRAMSGFMFGVPPTDLLTLLAVAVLLSAVTGAASFLPARRALWFDPMRAIRID